MTNKIITDSEKVEATYDEKEQFEEIINQHKKNRAGTILALDAISAVDENGYITVSKIAEIAGVSTDSASQAIKDKIKRGELEKVGEYNNGKIGCPAQIYQHT